MALKSQYLAEEKGAEISDLLDAAEKLIERTKVLYEQYFMGIQKVAPSQLHRDLERKIRELSQARIRNTALRYRLTTLTQKFGVYNTYWRRTLREIEQGRYVRDIARIKRKAERTGQDIPDEILAAMPKRMRAQVERDRAKVAKRAGHAVDLDDIDDADERDAQGEAPARATGRGSAARPSRRLVHSIADDELNALGAGGETDYAALMDSAQSALDALEMREVSERLPRELPPAQPPAPVQRATPPPVPAAAREQAQANPGPHAANPAAARSPAAPAGNTALHGAGAFSRRAAPRAAANPPRATANTPPPGMTEAEARRLYRRYVQARKQVGERTDNVSYDSLIGTLNRQAPQIMKQFKARGVEFDVAIKDDKVVLKAKPKRS